VRLPLFTFSTLLAIALTWSINVPTQAADPSPQFLGRLKSSGGDLIRFSPDGSFILTAGGGDAQIWNTKTLTAVGKPMPHDSEVIFARFADGGRQVITGTDGGVRRWNTRTGEEISPSP
jgi:WD40 repeat protein